MEYIIFQSKWVEHCVRRVIGKVEGLLDKEDVSAIKYAKAGGDFMGGIMLLAKKLGQHGTSLSRVL